MEPNREARSARTPRSKATRRERREQWICPIVLTDIVKFSELSTRHQEEAIDHLLQGLDKHLLSRRPLRSSSKHLNSTGDGFLLAIGTGERLDDLIIPLLDGVRALVHHCRTGTKSGLRFQIRVALHLGDLLVEPAKLPGGFAVGKGLNWAARLAGLASPSQVVVSEELAQEILDKVGQADHDKQLHPPRSSDPHEANVKHGRPARFRFLTSNSTAELSQESSDRLKLLQHADDHAERALRVVSKLIEALLPEVESSSSAPTRLTLWVPRSGHEPGSRELVRIPRALGEPRNAPSQKRTRYPLIDPHAGGPLCDAFRSGRPQVLCGLPDWSAGPEERARYRDRWRNAGVTEGQVDGFSRHARCVLAIPLALEPTIAGVLCADFGLPFDHDETRLLELCDVVVQKSGQFIASLLLLREG